MKDTIAAICTALSPSGIGKIRVSGSEAVEIVDKIFKSPGKNKLSESDTHTIHYGHIYNGKDVIDEVLVLLMKAPRTYTREDVVEIDCHGGLYVLKQVLNLLTDNGCRIAEPGEFTKRAFLNGRIDLTEAEAVMDLISSKSEMSLKNSVSILNGSLYKKISSIRSDVLYFIAKIEASLDDPEHMSLDGYEEELKEKLITINKDINYLIKSYDNGKIIKEGINTAIVGKPNVGKSSILNMILDEERAIVTDIAGTTRDTLEETVVLNGITLNLIDTAGIHETKDSVEKIGIERSINSISNADLVIYIVDSSRELDDSDREIISLINNKKTICLVNKSDLNKVTDKEDIIKCFNNCELPLFVETSALLGTGKEQFISILSDMFFDGKISFNDEVMISNLRQINSLKESYESINRVIDSIDNEMPEDFLSIDLLSAYASLGEIIGEEVSDDLVDKIFSEFCMGK